MTEHAAGIFVFFFLAEYASIILICILITIILLGGYDILTLIYFIENALYTLLFLFSTFIYIIYLNLFFFINLLINILEEVINNKIFNISLILDSNHSYLSNNLSAKYNDIDKLNLFYRLNNIEESFQFDNYILIIINDYNNFIKLNIKYKILELREIIYSLENFNFITNNLKNISNNNLMLSLTYALTISIKSIILIFFFI
jgi:NADH dehydrogenase